MNTQYREIIRSFTKIGAIAFGGPVAVLAMMEEEFSRRRAWVDAPKFHEMYAVCKLLPGPIATQMAIFLGFVRAGRVGGILAGIFYVLPSFVLVLGFSYLYVSSDLIQKGQAFFDGLQAAALAIIGLSAVQMGRQYVRQLSALGIIAVAAAVTLRYPTWEPVVILGFGLLKLLATRPRAPLQVAREGATPWLAAIGMGAGWTAAPGVLGSAALPALIWTCFKAGAFVFGTGLAVVPLLESAVVHQHGWLTSHEFMDGLALGQVTPGPVVITATFIGYKVAGLVGALAATTAIFLPGFINVLVLLPLFWHRVSGTDGARRFIDGAIPAVVGGILAATYKLGAASLTDASRVAIFAIALGLGLRFKTPAYILIPGAGVAMWILNSAMS